MAPPICSIPRKRYQALRDENGGKLTVTSPQDRPKSSSAINHGKLKPLPLSASHYKASDVFDIPAEENTADDAGRHKEAAGQARLTSSPAHTDSKSKLSDAGTSDLAISEQLHRHFLFSNHPVPSRRSIPQPGASVTSSTRNTKKGSARHVPKRRMTPDFPEEPVPHSNRNTQKEHLARPPMTERVALAHIATSKEPLRQRPKTKRRLPVGELQLVPSHEPQQHSNSSCSSSSYTGTKTQDPINDRRILQLEATDPTTPSVDSNETTMHSKPLLTSIRKRLKMRPLQNRSVTTLQCKHTMRRKARTPTASALKGADGFEPSELHIPPGYRRSRSEWHRSSPITTSGALQLQSGPLPDVDFEHDESSLAQSCQDGQNDGKRGADEHIDQHESFAAMPFEQIPRPRSMSRRRVAFSDRDDFVMAQLSSVSAPAREYSVSIDEEEDEDEDEDEDKVGSAAGSPEQEPENVKVVAIDDQQEIQSAKYDDELLLDDDEGAPLASEVKPREITSRCSRRRIAQVEEIEPENKLSIELSNLGFSTDFRHTSSTPGRLPRRSAGKRSMIEVDEAIVEDEPERQQVVSGFHVSHGPSDVADLDNEPFYVPEIPPKRLRPPRLRSILKTQTSIMEPHSQPGDTVENTRRNGVLKGSSTDYFASDATLTSASEGGNHVIIPRRSSHFFRDEKDGDVEGRNSEYMEPTDYTNSTQLHILRRNSVQAWSSSVNCPAPAPDLRNLTRTVSRGHGTISGIPRRRSRLPFVSPLKSR